LRIEEFSVLKNKEAGSSKTLVSNYIVLKNKEAGSSKTLVLNYMVTFQKTLILTFFGIRSLNLKK
jgi:hypothetical protein